jgi:hypothetical protein
MNFSWFWFLGAGPTLATDPVRTSTEVSILDYSPRPSSALKAGRAPRSLGTMSLAGKQSARQQQPAHNQAVRSAEHTEEVEPAEGQSWLIGLCNSDYDDGEIDACHWGCFIPCFQFGKTRHRLGQIDRHEDATELGENYNACNGACCSWAALCIFLPCESIPSLPCVSW